MTYGRHQQNLDWCVTATSPDAHLIELVERLNDGEAEQLASEWSCQTLQKIVDRLSGCIAMGCAMHRSSEAVQQLQAILDESAEEDERWLAELRPAKAEPAAQPGRRAL